MAKQFSTTIRDAWANQLEVSVGTAARLQYFAGPQPANCAAADSGTLLMTIVLPSDWMNASAAGVKTMLGNWSGVAIADGLIGHFRIKNSALTITSMQGTVTITGGGGDMTVDDPNVLINQAVTVTQFTLTAPHP